MLTDLSFLNEGSTWLPDDDDTKKRIAKYKRNYDLFENEHGNLESYKEAFNRIERVIGNFQNVISYATIINYHRLVSKKTADLLYSEVPDVDAGAENKETIENIERNTEMFLKLYQNAIDISRFGDGILQIYNNDNGNFEVTSPMMWIPVVDPANHKEITNHVLAWEYSVVNSKEKLYRLKVQIHYKGFYEERTYSLQSSQQIAGKFIIGKLLEEDIIDTGLSDFAIIHTTNLITSDRVTGIDDYEDIDCIIREILVRISQIARVLDKHADPSVSGPSSALVQDPASGEWSLLMGNYFRRDSADDPEPKYITWDGQLEASFRQIELLINNLYVISEMGSTLLGGEDKGNSNMSGRALKFKMISPLAKVKRLTMFLTPKVKKLYKLLSEYGGEGINNLDDAKITITWNDGLPNDQFEKAEIIEKRRNSGTMSIKSALIRYDNMSKESAEEEIDAINDEMTQMNPLTQAPFSGNNIEEGEQDEN